ncbi:hypothetical protein ACQYRI_08265 [Salmonella enterica]
MHYKRIFWVVTLALTISAPAVTMAKTTRLSDAEIKQRIIEESIDDYPGTCACPYNSVRNGSRCGGRSAWSRAGGYSPICYEREVSKDMIVEWRKRNGS